MPGFLALLVAGAFALAITPLLMRVAWSVGYLDQPNARKLHLAATPLLGGVAIFLAALPAWIATAPAHVSGQERELVFLLGGACIALGLGLWDDRFGMHPVVKLAGQGAAAGCLLLSGHVPVLGLPSWLDTAIVIVALVALMNATNFLDNMNGMLPGLAAIALLGFAWDSAQRGAPGLATAQCALAGACIGFLPYNFPRGRIFLGDAGSLFLGYSLGASAVFAIVAAPRGWGQLGPLLSLAYPAFDMIFVVVTRLRDGRKIYVGGKDHSNHRLASVLQCPKRTVLLFWASGAALSASGLAVLRLNRPEPTILLLVLWSILFLWAGRRLSSVPLVPSSSNSTKS
jgi:UDP-GlcNAc:undecaprenyl-phosphate/decaprenyl-phosphate GlcNAc-1-phosphate transferase